MTIKWRFLILGIQLIILSGTTYVLTGSPYSGETWFFGGLLGIAINPQLWEPYYPKPGDVIGNGLVFLFLYASGRPTITEPAWRTLAIVVSIAILLAAAGALLGARKEEGRLTGIGRAARMISQVCTAKVIYSSVFLLSAIEWRPTLDRPFWSLVSGWALILLAGAINWEVAWSTVAGKSGPCRIEGSLGPSVLLVSASKIPPPGTWVTIKSARVVADGVVLNRIRRPMDAWAEIHILREEYWEALISSPPGTIATRDGVHEDFIGSVDAGSTERILRFVSTRQLELGQVVSVPQQEDRPAVIYQLVGARIERSEVRGGAHLLVRSEALQLGVFDPESLRFVRHRWVASPGAAIVGASVTKPGKEPPAGWVLLGVVAGTDAPVYVDCEAACQGHLVILGMTKMGKTSLAVRIAKTLASTRSVTILDQTGEYVGKRGLTPYTKETDLSVPGLSVFEPKAEEVPADRALSFLRFLLKSAMEEYKKGTPFPRVVIIDEAHQFVPEPAGLGFNAPGRDSSFAIGLLMMQIRKYGISIFLISQRTAVVAKSALSQCENMIAFRSVDQTGLDYIEAVAGTEVRSLLPQLNQGEALVFGPAISSDSPVAIKVSEENKQEIVEPAKDVSVVKVSNGNSLD